MTLYDLCFKVCTFPRWRRSWVGPTMTFRRRTGSSKWDQLIISIIVFIIVSNLVSIKRYNYRSVSTICKYANILYNILPWFLHPGFTVCIITCTCGCSSVSNYQPSLGHCWLEHMQLQLQIMIDIIKVGNLGNLWWNIYGNMARVHHVNRDNQSVNYIISTHSTHLFLNKKCIQNM